MNDYLMTFYGDDFTGSTDVMEVLEWGGIPTILFLDPPDAQVVRERFPHVKVVGVAGVSRTMSPAEMDEALPPAFHALKALNSSFFHYKICSTFDSSPTVGSIGHATEIGRHVFDASVVPMMVGAPALRRYVAFSNLFARVDNITYRLDRHPTMSTHPITPMTESDLRRHLSYQTDLRIDPMTLWHMEKPEAEIDAYFNTLIDQGAGIILFDTINADHLHTIGRLLWQMKDEHTTFLVGSSGFEYALTHYLNTEGIIPKPAVPARLGAVDQLIVMSGSAAPATADQITWAMNNGFAAIRLSSADLIDSTTAGQARQNAIDMARSALGEGKSVLLYSVHGPDDRAIKETKARIARLKLGETHVGSLLGPQQGLILKQLLETTGIRRAVVCGGDTCGYSAKQLGIYALSAIAPVAPGAPMCRAYSDNLGFDGLEINLKAGQIGTPDFFEQIRNSI